MWWIKYVHKFSSGHDSEWEWRLINYEDEKPSDDDINYTIELVKETENEYNWSEHYRGIKHEIVELPPSSFLEGEIKRSKRTIESTLDYIKRCENQLKLAKLNDLLK